MQPGGEGRIPPEVGDPAPGRHERLLRNVLGRVPIDHQAEGQPEHPVAVTPDQHLERFRVSALGTSHQLPIVQPTAALAGHRIQAAGEPGASWADRPSPAGGPGRGQVHCTTLCRLAMS